MQSHPVLPVRRKGGTVVLAEIDRATWMLTEQLGVGITDAFIWSRAYAYVRDLRVDRCRP
jgi:hypothetical protein